MPAAIGAAVLAEIGLETLAASEAISAAVGYTVLSPASLPMTIVLASKEKPAHDSPKRDPAA